MSYVSASEYTAVPASVESGHEQPHPSAELLHRVSVSSRVVSFFCFVQMVLAGLGLFFGGNVIYFCLTSLFVSLGLTGVIKRRFRLVASHFVFSVIIYILSIFGLVYLILYCDDCEWPTYAVVGLYILIQAIGLKHSRLLMCALRQIEGTVCARLQEIHTHQEPMVSVVHNPVQHTYTQQSAAGNQSSTISFDAVPAPTAPVQPMFPSMYPHPMGLYPAVGPYANFPGYPMQPYPFVQGYPMMPTNIQEAQNRQ